MIQTRRHLDVELDQLRGDVVRLAAHVGEFIPRSAEVLLAVDLAGAQRLIGDDDIVDSLAIGVEDRCNQLLTLQHPVASDLRHIVTALRLTAEIERSADLMVDVAKATRRVYGVVLTPRVRGLIEQMSEAAAQSFRLAIDAYADADGSLAATLGELDLRLDELGSCFLTAIFDAHRRPEGLGLPTCVQLAMVGRYYERVGDHAVNIAKRVCYLVTGGLDEHLVGPRVRIQVDREGR